MNEGVPRDTRMRLSRGGPGWKLEDWLEMTNGSKMALNFNENPGKCK